MSASTKPKRTIRVPEADYLASKGVLDALGIDPTAAVRMFLKQVASTRSIPFPLRAPPELTIEEVAVTPGIQRKMDKVADAWKRTKSKRRLAG